MTIAEQHLEFKQRYDKLDSFTNALIEPEEIDVWFNLAQAQLFSNFVQSGLEKTENAKDFWQNLITNFTTTTFVNTVDSKPNGRFIVLPDNYKKAIEEECRIGYLDCNSNIQSKFVSVYPITHGEYNDVRSNPFKKPSLTRVNRLSVGKIGVNTNPSFELLFAPGTTLTNYYLRYYREPVNMQYGTQYPTPGLDIDCELSTEAQREIIKIAVALASKAVEDYQKYQIEEQSINNTN